MPLISQRAEKAPLLFSSGAKIVMLRITAG
jgi:hypothetical protein